MLGITPSNTAILHTRYNMYTVQLGTETIETWMCGCSAKQLWFQSRHLTEIVASGNHGRIPLQAQAGSCSTLSYV